MDLEPTFALALAPEADNTSFRPDSSYALLRHRIRAPNPTWEAEVDLGSLPYLDDHRVNGSAIFPGAGYVDAMLAAQSMLSRREATVLEDVEFRRMLRIDSHTLRTEVTGKGDLALYSRLTDKEAWTFHARASLSSATPLLATTCLDLDAIRYRCTETVTADSLYHDLSASGLQYGPCFRTIRGIWRNSAEVLVRIAFHSSVAQSDDRYKIHPTILDGAFQSLAAIIPAQGPGVSYVPARIERILFKSQPTASVWSYGRLTRNSDSAIEADLSLCDDHGRVIAEIRGLRCLRLVAGRATDNASGTRITRRARHATISAIQPAIEAVEPAMDPDPVLLPTHLPLVLKVSPGKSLRGMMFHETERRSPRLGEIELQVNAVSLNFKDVLKMSGRLSDIVTDDTFFGTDIGMEASATVVRVGEGVAQLRVGDRIIVMAKGGCFRSYLTVAVNELFWLPELPRHKHVELVGLPIVFATALYSLRDIARLLPGERVLLHSAAGGVGLAAIQVARLLGAEVLATAGSPEKRDYLRSLGIRNVMDSRSLDFADEIMTATQGHGVDVVLNFLSGEALEKSVGVLAPFGRLVEIGKRDIEENSRLSLRPFNRGLSFTAIDLDRMAAVRPKVLRALLHEIWEGLQNGVFEPLPVQVHAVSELGYACRTMLKAEHTGKVVVQIADQMVSAIPLRSKSDFCSNATCAVPVTRSLVQAEAQA